jgi:putative cardiolipin synthase
VEPENSYRVMIDEESGQLYWLTETDGQKVRYNKDPKSSFWQRFIVGFIRMLPVESQL